MHEIERVLQLVQERDRLTIERQTAATIREELLVAHRRGEQLGGPAIDYVESYILGPIEAVATRLAVHGRGGTTIDHWTEDLDELLRDNLLEIESALLALSSHHENEDDDHSRAG